MSQLYNLAGDAAKSVVNYSTAKISVAKSGLQNFAGSVYHSMQPAINAGKADAMAIKEHAGQIIDQASQQSIGSLARSGKQSLQNAGDYMVNTSFGQMASDARSAVTNDIAYKVAQQKLGQAGTYGKTMLNDLDAFYHNADGSYNRTKVGLTAAAGLGVAGIVGYNMND